METSYIVQVIHRITLDDGRVLNVPDEEMEFNDVTKAYTEYNKICGIASDEFEPSRPIVGARMFIKCMEYIAE